MEDMTSYSQGERCVITILLRLAGEFSGKRGGIRHMRFEF